MKPILRSPAITLELIAKREELRQAIYLDGETLASAGWQRLTYETSWNDKEDGYDELFDMYFHPAIDINPKFVGALLERWYQYDDRGETSTGNDLYVQFEAFLSPLEEGKDYICLRTAV